VLFAQRLPVPLAGLLEVLLDDPALAGAVERARHEEPGALELSAPGSAVPFILAALASRTDRTVLAVTGNDRDAETLTAELTSLLDPHVVAEYPAWETLPHERLSPRADTVGRRLAVRRRLRHPDPQDAAAGPLKVVVAPVRSVLQPHVVGLGDLDPVALRPGDECELDDVVARLVTLGYTRTDLVENRGDIAVRGGLLDIFPPSAEHPLRVEFWGDTVEEVRTFKVADQRSLDIAEQGVWAPPCRELLLTDSVRGRAKLLADDHPELADILDKLAEGIAVEGMESLAPALSDGMGLLVDELPDGALILVCDPERVRTRAADLVRTGEEFLEAAWSRAAVGGKAPIDLAAASLHSLADVRASALDRDLVWWSVSPFTADEETAGDDTLTLSLNAVEGYRGEMARATSDIGGWLHDGWRVVAVTAGHGSAERIAEVLREEGLAARLEPDIATAPETSVAFVTTGSLAAGFVSPLLRVALLTESDLFGRSTSAKGYRLPSRRRHAVDPLQLRPGDLVVHDAHGVGRYREMVQRTVQGTTREYLVVEYARGDTLFVPTDALDALTRYVGGEAPTLDRLGGSDWAKRKGRARKAVKEIAAELIRLYSARMAAPGYAFGPDTPWQRELEDAFVYVETPDQLRTIDEVKADMEAAHPMDRLICGDVGYGKTEIAVRAAFKAVQDGKQVAVLCPTTLLAQQHFTTFSERFAGFPVVVKPVSRFNTDREQNEILGDLAEGKVDVVVGTHRLLSTGTRFKDLGLIVVDEEQRFGVEHKEQLKALRTNVDVLAMSATPIPRTLEMAITGIREMSVIQTPPEERHPVLTFVGAYDEKQIAAAIRRELLRDGQVFYLHNRVESIDKAAARLRDLVPEARVATAHGQMNEDALEHVMVNFWEKQFDVLVCTTIVESGLDIPNANTLIVERAETLGLSQLHQLRGRVGRGRERSYAYFLYPADKPLSQNSHDRLATIAQHSELGAGMAVAMKDLEIRGAGNLLGGEQSGHIASVGFDLYVRLVGEAVANFKAGGSGEEEQPEVKVDLPVDAHIPHDYVDGERLRLEAYRRIAQIASEGDIDEVRAELTDRYGTPPEPVELLLSVARLRLMLRQRGLAEAVLQGNQIRFGPTELRDSQAMRLQRLYPRTIVKAVARTILVPRPSTARVAGQPLRDAALLAWCSDLLEAVWGTPEVAAAMSGSDNRGTRPEGTS
jgi:transcription-repair coupling factor (superfamily II helicase)